MSKFLKKELWSCHITRNNLVIGLHLTDRLIIPLWIKLTLKKKTVLSYMSLMNLLQIIELGESLWSVRGFVFNQRWNMHLAVFNFFSLKTFTVLLWAMKSLTAFWIPPAAASHLGRIEHPLSLYSLQKCCSPLSQNYDNPMTRRLRNIQKHSANLIKKHHFFN